MAGAGGFATKQATPDTTAGGTLLVAARGGREAVTFINHGTTVVWIGHKGVTNTTGARLPGVDGASITIFTQDEVWGLVDAGSQTVSVLESY